MPPLLDGAVGSRSGDAGSDPRLPLGLTLPLGFVATFVAAVPLGLSRGWLLAVGGLAGMAAVVAAVSWTARAGAAACIAGMGWLMLDGFVVHRYGDLAWNGGRDPRRLTVLLAAALAASIGRALLLAVRSRHPAESLLPRPRTPGDDGFDRAPH